VRPSPCIVLAIVVLSCARVPHDLSPTHSSAVKAAAATAAAPSRAEKPPTAADDVATVARQSCDPEIARELASPALPGASDFEARRAETFARAKADPVLFVREPRFQAASPEGDRLRQSVLGAAEPVKALYEVYPALAKRRDVAREVLLTDGYLYAPSPWFAAALANLVKPEDLFQDETIWILRGNGALRLERRRSRAGPYYVYADGAEAGQRVKLLLLDRIAHNRSELFPALHRDVLGVAKELGFSEMRVRHLSDDHIVADLRYGDVWVPSLLASDGPGLALTCESIPSGRAPVVAEQRKDARRRGLVLERLRAVMHDQVAEALPFDEPKTEFGQEDGKLRQHWNWAYRYGRTQFEFNEDRYRVFDAEGRPRVPQVCIDFITDTFERAGGSWYRPRGAARERVPGTLDFADLGIDNERSVERFVEFAKAHPDWFDVFELPEDERVPYARRSDFFAHLFEHRDRYQPGDVVTIYGLRDDDKMHYHSFFIYESDPVTGSPSLVAANAGHPRIRPWEAEMVTAPLRSIRARIRPRLEWLERVTVPRAEVEAATLTKGPARTSAL
jgi:hypothetical protein